MFNKCFNEKILSDFKFFKCCVQIITSELYISLTDGCNLMELKFLRFPPKLCFVLRPSINAIAHAQSQRFDDSTNSDFPYCNDATETCICFLWQHALKQKLEYHYMPPPPLFVGLQ